MTDESGKVVFTAPEELTALQELPEGETLELTAVFRKEADGKVCLVEADGVEISSYDEEGEETEEGDDEPEVGGDMIQAMENL